MGDGESRAGAVGLAELRGLIDDGLIETVILAQVDHMGRLFGKRLEARAFAADPEAGIHTCSVNYAWDVLQTFLGDVEFTGWRTGYHDMWGRPDWTTARVIPWASRSAMILCDTCTVAGEEVPVAPRTILRRQVEKARALGFGCQIASELEFHVYRDAPDEARARGFRDLHPSSRYHQDHSIVQQSLDEDFLAAVRRQLTDAGIPVECSKGEYGWGETEVNLAHASAVEAADRHVLYKLAVKELARQHDRLVTFMALPDAAGPTCSGASCHVHLSLWDEALGGDPLAAGGAADSVGGNAFSDSAEPDAESDQLRHFLGGLMYAVPDLLPLYAPYINSYKRLQAEHFCPCTNAWGHDNRSVAFRVVGRGPSKRVENRIPGADVNPYLVYAAMLGSGLYGVEHELEPGPFAAANAREMAEVQRLPWNLPLALERFVHSELAAEILTSEVVRHLARFYEFEVEQYFSVVTDWERRSYFEGV